jgi:hypothetical protein
MESEARTQQGERHYDARPSAGTCPTINAYQLGPLGRGFGKKETLP